VVVEDHPAHGRLTSMAIETRGLCAVFDPAIGSLTLWAAHQGPYHLRGAVAARLRLPAESIRVIAPDTGGGFGPKEGIYPEDVLVPLLAVRLGRPVKWIQTRAEFVACTHQAREQAHHARLAAARDGRILGLDVRIVKDVGAYHCFSIHEPTNTINHLPSQYKVPAFRAEGFSVVTNKVPSAPYRGAGRPEAILVIERLLDRLAAKLGIDPAEVRSRNLIAPAEMPYRPGLVYRDGVPVSYDGGDYPLELRRALDLLDYAGWRKRQPALRAQGRRVGLGIAGYLEAGGSVRPAEARPRNLIAPAEMPYRPGLVYRDGVPVSYDGGDYPLELRRALDLLDYAGWRKRQPALRAQGRRVGLGIAGYLEAGGSVRPG